MRKSMDAVIDAVACTDPEGKAETSEQVMYRAHRRRDAGQPRGIPPQPPEHCAHGSARLNYDRKLRDHHT